MLDLEVLCIKVLFDRKLISSQIAGLDFKSFNWTLADAALDNVTLATTWSDLERLLKSSTPKMMPSSNELGGITKLLIF